MSGACKSCEITPTAFMVWSPQCARRNEVHIISSRNLIVKIATSIRESPKLEHHLCMETILRLSMELLTGSLALMWAFLLCGAPMRIRGSLHPFDTSIEILAGQLKFVFLLLLTFYIYIVLPWLYVLSF